MQIREGITCSFLQQSPILHSNVAKLIEFQQLAFECSEMQKGHKNNCASGEFDRLYQGAFKKLFMTRLL